MSRTTSTIASPGELRERVLFGTTKVDGGTEITLLGVEFFAPSFGRKPTADELTREFRDDPSGGRDPETRLRFQARDGVSAEVIFPNSLLALGATSDAELNIALGAGVQRFRTRGVRGPRRPHRGRADHPGGHHRGRRRGSPAVS